MNQKSKNSVNITVDFLLDGLEGDSQQADEDMYLDDSSDVAQVGINIAFNCKLKDGVTVSAPAIVFASFRYWLIYE